MRLRRDIQILRGFSVVAIVFFHLNEHTFVNGYLGVELFFVISGYVVTPLIVQAIQESFNYRNPKPLLFFYRRRLLRLGPALLTTLSICFVPLILFANVDDLGSIASQALYSVVGIGNLGAYINSGNYFSSNLNPLLHTWSLAVEEQIYLLIPIFFAFSMYLFRRKISFYVVLLSLTVFGFLVSIPSNVLTHLYEMVGVSFVDDFSFYSPVNRLWQFGLGGLASLTSFKKFKGMGGLGLSCVGGLFAIVTYPLFSEDVSSFLVSITCAFILYSKVIDGLFGTPVSVLSWLGDRSYSIYLLHMPIIYLTRTNLKISGGLSTFLIDCIVILGTIVLGSIQYKYIEQKFRMGLHTETFPSVRKKFTLFLFLSSFVCSSNLTLASLAADKMAPIIPSKLTQVSRDTHILRLSNCVDVDFEPSNCVWGNPQSDTTVVLIGDSQAYAAADGLAKTAKLLDFKLVVGSVSGCPFLDLVTSGRKIVDCEKFKLDVFDYIKNTRPNVVVVANRSSGYLNPESEWRTFLNPLGQEISTAEVARTVYEESLARLALDLRNTSDFVLFQNIPEPENIGSPPSVWSYLFNKDAYDGTTKSKVFIDRDVRSLESQSSLKYGFTLFDPVKILCPDSCTTGINVEGKFMDSWHLSTIESERLESSLTPLLQRLLQRPK